MIPDSQLLNQAPIVPGEVDLSCPMDPHGIYDMALLSSDRASVDLGVSQNITTPRATTPKASLQQQGTKDASELQDGGGDVELNVQRPKVLAGTKRPVYQTLSTRSIDGGLASPGNPQIHKRQRTGDRNLPIVEYPESFPDPGSIAHYGTEGSKAILHPITFPFTGNRTPRTPDHKAHRRVVSPRPQALNEELILGSSSAGSPVQRPQQDTGKPRAMDVDGLENGIADDTAEIEYLPFPPPRGSYSHSSTPSINQLADFRTPPTSVQVATCTTHGFLNPLLQIASNLSR